MTWSDHPDAPPPGTLLCLLEDISDGGGSEFVFGDGDKPFRLFVVRRGPEVRAYVNACAHFGVPLNQVPAHGFLMPEGHIECQVHYARYAFEDGRCLRGECGNEGLVPVPVVVDDTAIRIGDHS